MNDVEVSDTPAAESGAQMKADPRIEAGLAHARRLGEVGVQVAAYLDGELLVDAWTGTADPAGSGRMVDGETLFTSFSVTKGVTATLAARMVERGNLAYDALVTDYWPEYGVEGKGATTVGDALCHRAGAPRMPDGVTPEQMSDWDFMVSHVERAKPEFEPGTRNAYHVLTWGWLVGELIRRADPERRDLRRILREELLDPLGIKDIYYGLPDEKLWRISPVLNSKPAAPEPLELYNAAMPIGVFPGTIWNRPDIRRSLNPAGVGIMTARAGARLFGLLAGKGELDGRRLLSEELVSSFAERRKDAESDDQTFGFPLLVGGWGFWLGGPVADPVIAHPVVGNGDHIICSPGAGGAIAWADLDTGLSVSIQHNMMHLEEMLSPDEEVNPFIRLADAVREVAADARA
jgi:CubicO group peptidase (beta-lactamase class C family)